jgi:hypothetical protein
VVNLGVTIFQELRDILSQLGFGATRELRPLDLGKNVVGKGTCFPQQVGLVGRFDEAQGTEDRGRVSEASVREEMLNPEEEDRENVVCDTNGWRAAPAR